MLMILEGKVFTGMVAWAVLENDLASCNSEFKLVLYNAALIALPFNMYIDRHLPSQTKILLEECTYF